MFIHCHAFTAAVVLKQVHTADNLQSPTEAVTAKSPSMTASTLQSLCSDAGCKSSPWVCKRLLAQSTNVRFTLPLSHPLKMRFAGFISLCDLFKCKSCSTCG